MSESRILAVVQMQEEVFRLVLFVNVEESLVSLEEGVSCEEVDGFRVIELEFFLDDHDEFEDSEGLEYEYSKIVT